MLSDLSALKCFSNGSITVSVPVIELGSVVAVKYMQQLDSLGERIRPIFSSANGADQMQRINQKDEYPLFAVCGIAASSLAMRGSQLSRMYQLVCPLHHISQHVIGNASICSLDKRHELIVCNGGFAVYQAAATKGKGIIPKEVGRKVVEATNPLAWAARLEENQVIICYEPVSQIIRLDHGLNIIPNSDYTIYIGLFAHKQFVKRKSRNGNKGKQLKAFIQVFTQCYIQGRSQPREALKMLRDDPEFCSRYRAAIGMA
jgi:hypothetical protein